MRKLILLVAITLTSISTFAAMNFYTAELHLNDGSLKKGLANFVEYEDGDYVYFKLSEKSDVEKIESSSISKIVYTFDGEDYDYEYLKVYKGWKQVKIKESPIWVEVIKRGIVTLYVARTTVEGGVGVGAMPSSRTSVGFRDYYVMRDGEPAAKLYATISTFNNNQTFRAKAPLYFSDYPELADKIKNKEYSWKNLEEVIDIYNNWVEENK